MDDEFSKILISLSNEKISMVLCAITLQPKYHISRIFANNNFVLQNDNNSYGQLNSILNIT